MLYTCANTACVFASIFITAAIGSLVQTGITYPAFAEQRSWPIGEWASGNGWYIYHGIAALSVLLAAWMHGGLIGILVVVVLSFVGAFLIVHTLRSWSQMLSPLSLPLAIAWHWLIPY